MEDVPKSDRQAWYESVKYKQILKTVTWFPSAGAYQEWEIFRTPRPKQRGGNTLKHRQVLTAVLTDPHVLKRENSLSMTPFEAFAGPSTDFDIDLDYHNYQAQTACDEEQRPERQGGSPKNITDVPDSHPMDLAKASAEEAIDAEEHSVRRAAAAGGSSDPELRLSRKITVQQILEMYNSSAPLSELPEEDVVVS